MRRRLAMGALAALLIGGCGGQDDGATFSDAAGATCEWTRQSVDVLPEQTSQLVGRAAAHLRGMEAPASQRAAAGELVAELRRLSRSTAELSSVLDAGTSDPARLRRLRAAVQDDQQAVVTAAGALDARGCDAVAGMLLRRPARAAVDGGGTTGATARLSRTTYRTRLRKALGDLSQRTTDVQATMRSGTGSATTLTAYATSVTVAVKRLERLRPPASAASAHRDVIAGLRAARNATTRAARHLRAGRSQDALRVFERYLASRSPRQLTAALVRLRDRRYLTS